MRISVLYVSAFLTAAFGTLLSAGAHGQTSIAKDGTTVVHAVLAGKKIEATITTVRIGTDSKLFPKIEWGAPSVTLVQDLEITVEGKKAFVPRSVFADLLDPRTASIRLQKGVFVLTAAGADGAESYFVRVVFDGTRVKRRMVYSSLVPATPTEDTAYRLTELKDE